MSKQPIRSVAVFSNLFPPQVTGSSVQASTLARKLVEQGVKVTVFTSHLDKDTPKREVVDGVEIHRLPCLHLPKLPIAVNFPWLSFTMLPGNYSYMKRVMKERECELIHVHNHMFDMAFNGVIMSKQLGLPLVVTIHSIIHHPNKVYNAILSAADATLLRWAVIRQSSQVIDLDSICAEYRESRFDAHNGTLIPLGTEFPEVPSAEDVESLRQKYQFEGKKVILSVGHLHHLRNRLDLIRGFAKTLDTYPDTRLVIVGAKNFPPAEELARELGVEDKVIFTGKQPRSVVAAFMELCDAHSMWFDMSEDEPSSLGNANIEAMLTGKPVFGVFDENAYGPGVLKHGENIFILPWGKAEQATEAVIRELWGNPEKAVHIGQAAKEIARKTFSWETVTQQHMSLFTSLIRGE